MTSAYGKQSVGYRNAIQNSEAKPKPPRIKNVSDQDESGKIAIGLYAVLARDACDFIDMVNETKDEEALKTLYLMLTFKDNPNTSKDDLELNEIGASILEGILDKRGIERPPMPEKPEPAITIPFGDI